MNSVAISKVTLALAILISMSACKEGAFESKAWNDAKAAAEAAKKNSAKAKGDKTAVDPEAAYVAQIIIEGGRVESEIAPTALMTEDYVKTHKPSWQASVCINKSGEVQVGKLVIESEKIKAPIFRNTQLNDDKSIKSQWDLTAVTINYEAKGFIDQADKNNAKADFYINMSLGEFARVTNVVTSVESGDLGEFPSLFTRTINQENKDSDNVVYFEIDGVSYYLKNKVVAYSKTDGKPAQIVSECETQAVPEFIKFGSDFNVAK